jgi:hypothetical protein
VAHDLELKSLARKDIIGIWQSTRNLLGVKENGKRKGGRREKDNINVNIC